jgi:hypothetical protein
MAPMLAGPALPVSDTPSVFDPFLFADTDWSRSHAIGVVDINMLDVVGRSLLCWLTTWKRIVFRAS